MYIRDLLGGSTDDHSLLGASDAEIAAVQRILVEKNGRPYLQCPVRKKDILAKPEEVIRQLWVHRLVHHYGFPLERMTVEYPVTFGRDTSKRADRK